MDNIEEPESIGQQPELTARPWWKRRVMIAGAVIVLAAAGTAIALAATSSPGTIQVHGVLALGPLDAVDSAADTPADGDPCQAMGGYTDIAGGAAVVVGNATGQTIGTGALQTGIEANVDDSAGTPLGNCAFQFSVTVPAGESTYTVTISHRGTQAFTPAQIDKGVLLTLGE